MDRWKKTYDRVRDHNRVVDEKQKVVDRFVAQEGEYHEDPMDTGDPNRPQWDPEMDGVPVMDSLPLTTNLPFPPRNMWKHPGHDR